MTAPATPPDVVDARGMLCAQALAVVAQAVARLPVGAACEVWSDADDVQRDLIAWAQSKQHRIRATDPDHLTIERTA